VRVASEKTIVARSVRPSASHPPVRVLTDEQGSPLIFGKEETFLAMPWRHLVTAQRRMVEGIAGAPGGWTTWCSQVGETTAVLTWEWADVGPALALADALAVEGNIFPWHSDGTEMSVIERRRTLMTITMQLPWQEAVKAQVQRREVLLG
jgi:hypothetical protein